ncbi:C40 family peptidase [Thermoactinospora rubra]|uniref:C40 family peptidase n=1 Tax=Thermoactinospora rubra TaxID=1088767 RepID=UPI000A0F965A|nr:C40 family peptidase [Thermoactinospora rubra]
MSLIRAGLLASCLILGACLPAVADPAPSSDDVARARQEVGERSRALDAVAARLAAAQARLDALAATAERLVEAYNGERVRLAHAAQAYQEARARVASADQRVEEVRAEVAVIAAQSYGGYDITRPAFGLLSREDFLHRVSVLRELGGERALVLQRMRDAQIVASVVRTQAQHAYDAQRAAAERAEAAKEAAERAVAEQIRETETLKATEERLQRRLDAARGKADRLARARAAALSGASVRNLPLSYGSSRGEIVARWALSQLGKPYVWAAAGPSSYDCSGLTMRAWERVGIRLDHWTGTQWTSGPHVPLNQLRPGDLLFFGYLSRDPGTIHHVGIYIGMGLMVHAPQTGDVVRVASMWRSDLVGATRPAG